jgi:hypothetical protein
MSARLTAMPTASTMMANINQSADLPLEGSENISFINLLRRV